MSDVVKGNAAKAAAGTLWKDKRYAYDAAGNVEYIGRTVKQGLATTSGEWEVWKVTYSSGNVTRIEGPLQGDMDDPASMSWT